MRHKVGAGGYYLAAPVVALLGADDENLVLVRRVTLDRTEPPPFGGD